MLYNPTPTPLPLPCGLERRGEAQCKKQSMVKNPILQLYNGTLNQ